MHGDRQQLIQPNLTSTPLVLIGNVSAAALRAVEEYRQSGPLSPVLDLRAQAVYGDPAALTTSFGHGLSIGQPTEEWVTQLENVTAASYVDVSIPVTNDPELVTAAGRVREARAHIRGDRFETGTKSYRMAHTKARQLKTATTKP